MSYTHITFTALTRKQFRSGLIEALRADLAIDIATMSAPESARDCVLRHGIHVNGRHIGYEARINAAGNLTVTDLRVLNRDRTRDPRPIRTIDEIRSFLEVSKWAKGKVS